MVALRNRFCTGQVSFLGGNMRFEEIPGVEITTLKPFRSPDGQSAEGILGLDLDDVLAWSRKSGQQRRFYEQLRPITDAAGLDWRWTELAHKLEEREALRRDGQPTVDGPEALFAAVAVAMREDFQGDEDTLLRHQMRYQRLVEAIENIPKVEGMRETLTEIRQRWPRVALIGGTLCPTWLAEYRLIRGGLLLDLLDGYVAVKKYLPSAEGHRFPLLVAESHAWMKRMMAGTAQYSKHMCLRVGVPGLDAKPNILTAQALCKWAGIAPDNLLMVDDNPKTGGMMAVNAGAVAIHAVYGCQNNGVRQNGWPPEGSMLSIHSPGELIAIMESKFGPGVTD
jgi:hypothetical protein